MSKKSIARFAGIAAGAAMVVGFAAPAGAQTVAELTAQIAALMAKLQSMSGASAAINSDLTVGSRGAQVVVLQNALVAGGYLSLPAGVAPGYFGSLTKAAVARWQAAVGVSATGYFGPISRAKFNGSVVGGTVVGGTVVGGTTNTSGGVITTPGVEGSVTASLAPVPSSGTKLYENSSKTGVLGIKLEAKTSDIKIERIKLDLDESGGANSDSDLYRKIAQKIYVTDGSNVLASMDLNNSTVVEDGNDRFVTLTGINYVVPKDSTRTLTIALDARSTWDSVFDNDNWTITVPVNGVRGIDGAGIDQYSPSTAFSQTFQSAAELASTATVALSTNSGTPAAAQVIATSGSDRDEINGLELLKMDFKANQDRVEVTDLVTTINRSGNTSTATATVAYLMDGSTVLDSATVVGTSVSASTATFDKVNFWVEKDATRTLRVVIDVVDAGTAATTFSASSTASQVTALNSLGDNIVESGSAAGNVQTIRTRGPEVSLVSKSVTSPGVPQSDTSTNLSTSTLTATFNVTITARGGALILGTVASGTPLFASSTASFKVYRNGSFDASVGAGATSTSYSIGPTCVPVGTNSCELAEGASVTVPVTFSIIGRTAAGVSLTRGSVYSVGFEGLSWLAKDSSTAAQTTTFMAGLSDWRTSDTTFP